ncbi:sulfatase-like hydrolase/transferase [Arthrobacter sp. StoSoilB20]|uniref:sulfatase-like hydrolase/transferase n=1 Tax=Arthrobacter sp. StoSoilB20 TaxID=2830995 RepID=UPI001CC56E85|nr:sulfatase-like hydrolase/transferase [Arthrobacter sp. StoSoilB20]BCW60183.1 arylsulfatase A family protein [Arthrobacter sp. StoSoilB20]
MPHKKPNIIFILSDDQGAWALGCGGNDEIHTPHLDALADRGTRLENFFCASPVCSPARASLMTGDIPSRHGVHDYLAGVETGPEAVDFLQGQRLFTDDLADAGYRLGLSGKWHLGANDTPRRGFSHWFALEGGGSPYDQAVMYRYDGVASHREEVTGYLTDAITRDALGFIEKASTRPEPFFLAINYTAPHKPWKGQHPIEFGELYADCAFTSCPQEPLHPWSPTVNGVPIGGEADVRAALVGYFAAVSAMDVGIGEVLGRLEDLGLADNTLVIFSSDNGFNCGHHGIWGKGNGTFPQNVYDSSIKVPAIFALPGRIRQGAVLTELLSAYDAAATVLELAGLDAGPFEEGPGKSFAGLLRGLPDPARTGSGGNPDDGGQSAAAGDRAVVVFDEYGPVRMIRSAEWKYVHRYPHGPHELYSLVADPDERDNLVDDPVHALRAAGMRGQLQEWFHRHAVPGFDGSSLPVAGAGQTASVVEDPLGAFTPPNWDGTAAAGLSS